MKSQEEGGSQRGQRPDHTVISGERARQGRIVLNTPRHRYIFVGGLAAFVLLVAVGGLLA